MAARKHSLVTGSSFSLTDFRSAKRTWSTRLLAPPPAARDSRVLASAQRAAPFSAAAGRRNPNVVGVGIAEKTVDGKPTGVLAVKFFVKTKFPKAGLTKGLMLPSTIDGLPVDVEQSGAFRAFKQSPRRSTRRRAGIPNPRVRLRPARPGCSVGFRIAGDAFVMTGTFGALVKTARTVYLLSNNHVLADENRLPLESPIYQPALMDKGRIAHDQIAQLTRFIKLRPDRYNQVDAAIAKPLAKKLVSTDVLHIGDPKGTAAAALDMMVHKFGRTTTYTVGRVTSIDTDTTVEYATGEFTFESQIVIRGSGSSMFSDSGDSGSIILERDTNAAVGLLFGGSASFTLANPIGSVLRALRVRMA